MQQELRETATQRFYGLCDETMKKTLGEEVSQKNRHLLEGLLIVLGSVYGLSRERMVGDPKSDDPRHRFNNVNPMVRRWMSEPKIKRAAKDPFKVLKAIRKIPAYYARFPTEHMIEGLIRGEKPVGYPEGWLR